jgi:putative PIG3 family NAD(P)H quinone oxidoreductase
MHAIVIESPGDADVLTWREIADPTPGPGEVLVEVAASAVNRADILQRKGLYPPPPGASDIPGLECSGRIIELGPGVDSVSIGDEVCCLLAGGGYATKVAVPVGQCMSIPAGVDTVTAASLPEVACTVWSNLVMVAGLTRGDWLLVHGGAGGIGTMAIQVARLLGAHVAVTAGSQAKLDTCAQLGAEVCINYRDQDFVEVIRAETGGRGVDVVLDNMGAAYLQRNVDVLTRGGRVVIIGLQGGIKGEVDLGVLLRKSATIHATTLRSRPLDEKADICDAVERHVWPWIATGLLRPVVDRAVPMADAAAAHRALEAGEVTGKLLLLP